MHRTPDIAILKNIFKLTDFGLSDFEISVGHCIQASVC